MSVKRGNVTQICYQAGKIYSEMHIPKHISESAPVFPGENPDKRGQSGEYRFPIATIIWRFMQATKGEHGSYLLPQDGM